jgi:hypothetical protein
MDLLPHITNLKIHVQNIPSSLWESKFISLKMHRKGFSFHVVFQSLMPKSIFLVLCIIFESFWKKYFLLLQFFYSCKGFAKTHLLHKNILSFFVLQTTKNSPKKMPLLLKRLFCGEIVLQISVLQTKLSLLSHMQ